MDIYLVIAIVAFVLGFFTIFAVTIPTMIRTRVGERERLEAESNRFAWKNWQTNKATS